MLNYSCHIIMTVFYVLQQILSQRCCTYFEEHTAEHNASHNKHSPTDQTTYDDAWEMIDENDELVFVM